MDPVNYRVRTRVDRQTDKYDFYRRGDLSVKSYDAMYEKFQYDLEKMKQGGNNSIFVTK